MITSSRLIIIGGPSRAGKSYLIDRIQRGEVPGLCSALGIDDPASWTVMNARQCDRTQPQRRDRLLLHYDFYSQYSPSSGFHRIKGILDQFSSNVCAATLQTEPGVLVQRTSRKIWEKCAKLFSNQFQIRDISLRIPRLWKQRQHYADRLFVAELYEKWYRFLDDRNVTRHWIIDPTQPDSLTRAPLAEPTRVAS